MFLHTSYIYNKFVNSLIKKGKKIKIQKLFHKFYYNINSTLFYGYWRYINKYSAVPSFFNWYDDEKTTNNFESYDNSCNLIKSKKEDSKIKSTFLISDLFYKKNFKDYIKKKYYNFFFLSGCPSPILFLLINKKQSKLKNDFFLSLIRNSFYRVYVRLFNLHFKQMRLKEFRTVKYIEKKKRFYLLKDFLSFLKVIITTHQNFFKKNLNRNEKKKMGPHFKLFSSLWNSTQNGEFWLYSYNSSLKKFRIKDSSLIPYFEPGGSRLSKLFFFREMKRNRNIFNSFISKFVKFRNKNFRVKKTDVCLKNKNFLSFYNSLHNLAYFYSKLSFMHLNFFVSQFLIFQIVYSLLPFLGLRMTSVQKEGKSLKKKGKRRKPYGIPIVISQKTQITYALGFFKKSLSSAVNKSKSVGVHSFKEVLTEELLNFLFFKNSVSLRFKKDLYRKIIDFRSNFHFRWLTSRSSFKLKDYYTIEKSSVTL